MHVTFDKEGSWFLELISHPSKYKTRNLLDNQNDFEKGASISRGIMSAKKWLMLFINLLGGGGVIGSYVWGFLTHPDAGQALWGGVPDSIRPFYTAGMFLAATGYFAFTYFILLRLNPSKTRVLGRFPFGLFNILYAAILVPSALWMPLTFWALEGSSLGLLWAVRIVLAVVGLASVGLLFALLKVEPRLPRWAHWLAVAGCVGFCLQTAILDAIIWVVFFRV